jgi:thiamine pyrophosphokinase
MSANLSQIKSIIVLDGDFPPREIFKTFPSDIKLIAADAAAWGLYDIGIQPDIIIGDLESLYTVGRIRQQDPKVIFKDCIGLGDSDQETTDFEKSLNYAAEQNMGPLLILGLFGKEIDHSLYNLSHLINYATKIKLMGLHVLPDGKQQWILPLCQSGLLHIPANTKLSILPMPALSLSAPNLKWPLGERRFDLTQFQVRNETTTADTPLQLHSGQGLLIINSDLVPGYTANS